MRRFGDITLAEFCGLSLTEALELLGVKLWTDPKMSRLADGIRFMDEHELRRYREPPTPRQRMNLLHGLAQVWRRVGEIHNAQKVEHEIAMLKKEISITEHKQNRTPMKQGPD